MKKVAMIPARLEASRFPGKLMQQLGDKTVIATTFITTRKTNLFDDVVVVTDSPAIADEIKKYNGSVFMSQKKHQSGSDRIAEAAEKSDADILVNVQGDTPFVGRETLKDVLEQFKDEEVQVASIMELIFDKALLQDPNCVKVCVDKNTNSLFFSRSVIPYPRSKNFATKYYKHIGVYAYRKQVLLNFTSWPVSPLEDEEKLECLRLLENGVKIKMVLAQEPGIDINTPDDLNQAITFLNSGVYK